MTYARKKWKKLRVFGAIPLLLVWMQVPPALAGTNTIVALGGAATQPCVPPKSGTLTSDGTNAKAVVGLLDCERAVDKTGPSDRILYLFSDSPSLSAIPDSIRKRIEVWRKGMEADEMRSCKCQKRIDTKFLR